MADLLRNPMVGIALIFAVMVVPGCVVAAVYYWWKFRHDETLAMLKHELAARGMSAKEICEVVAAGVAPSEPVEAGLDDDAPPFRAAQTSPSTPATGG